MVAEDSRLSVVHEIALALKDVSADDLSRYDGVEWAEAVSLLAELPQPVYLKIPWCVSDYVLDEFGQVVMDIETDDSGRVPDPEAMIPRRAFRVEVLAILAWIPLKRKDPDLTLQEVQMTLNEGNIRTVLRKVFYFWGVDLERLDAAVDHAAEQSEAEERAEEPANFQE
jgi:hypothetical protein